MTERWRTVVWSFFWNLGFRAAGQADLKSCGQCNMCLLECTDAFTRVQLWLLFLVFTSRIGDVENIHCRRGRLLVLSSVAVNVSIWIPRSAWLRILPVALSSCFVLGDEIGADRSHPSRASDCQTSRRGASRHQT